MPESHSGRIPPTRIRSDMKLSVETFNNLEKFRVAHSLNPPAGCTNLREDWRRLMRAHSVDARC